jgi:hypothetical protein
MLLVSKGVRKIATMTSLQENRLVLSYRTKYSEATLSLSARAKPRVPVLASLRFVLSP